MLRSVISGLALVLLLGPSRADDKTDTVSWERESNGIDMRVDMGKDKLKMAAFGGENGVIVTCKMTIDKEGLVKATITDVEEKGTFPNKPKVGLEFSFKWKVDGDKATLSDLTGEGLDDAKPVVEGEYKKKK